jgi:hypothetical protein
MPNQTRRKQKQIQRQRQRQRRGGGILNRLKGLVGVGSTPTAKNILNAKLQTAKANAAYQRTRKARSILGNIQGLGLTPSKPTNRQQINLNTNAKVKKILRDYATMEGANATAIVTSLEKAKVDPVKFQQEVQDAVNYIESMKNLDSTNITQDRIDGAKRALLVLRHAAALKTLELSFPVLFLTIPVDVMFPGQGKMPLTEGYFALLNGIKGSTATLLGIDREKETLERMKERLAESLKRNGAVNYGSVSSETYNFDAAKERARLAQEERLNAEYRAAAATLKKKPQGKFFPTSMKKNTLNLTNTPKDWMKVTSRGPEGKEVRYEKITGSMIPANPIRL